MTKDGGDLDEKVAQLIPARVASELCFLASSAATQLDLIEKGTVISLTDVAEDLENWTGAWWMSVEQGLVTEATGTQLRELNELLKEMSGSENARLWVQDAVQSAEWSRVRNRARAILNRSDVVRYLADPPPAASELVELLRRQLDALSTE